jgi:acylphosphatase
MSDERAVRGYRVTGRVQGVGFRWWTRKLARDLGLVGRVRNLEDGSVDVRAAGDEGDLERLEQALRRGPPTARVDAVEPIDVEPLGGRNEGVMAGWSDFEIGGE